MTKIAPTRPPAQRSVSATLPAGPTAAAAARRCVQAAIESWGVPADPYVAALLTSELVTNAILHASATVQLFVTCSAGYLEVYVQDMSWQWPSRQDASVDAEHGRGLLMVDTLATDWGCYATSTGKAVYFTLAFAPSKQ